MTQLSRASLQTAAGSADTIVPARFTLPHLERRRLPSPAARTVARLPMRTIRAMSCISSGSKDQLWNSRMGIRFSPSPEPRPLYPILDVRRFTQCVGEAAEEDAFPDDPPDQTAGEAVRNTTGTLLTESNIEPPEPERVLPNQDRQPTLKKPHSKAVLPQAIASEPPTTSLPFVISHEMFYAAREAAKGSRESFWSHTMYRREQHDALPDKVKVHYCTSRHTMEHVCKKHFVGEPVLGFDLEWLPYSNRQSGARENVSLIQVASPGRIGLFHLAFFADKDVDKFAEQAPIFREIMEDPTVSKVGVHVQGDCTRLNNFLGVKARGVFELSHMYKQVRFSGAKNPRLVNKIPVALATQVHEHLGLPLFKGESVRASNWMKTLNAQQMLYSASDAYAGLQLYHVLDAKREALDPRPPRPHHAELRLPIPVIFPEEDSEESIADDALVISAEGNVEAVPLLTSVRKPPVEDPRDPRIIAAEEKAKSYRETKRSTVSAGPAALRAYYIWHGNADLAPLAIGQLLRDPPLKTNTVVSYILDAIVKERMPYDKMRLKADVLPLLDQKVAVGSRYGALVRSCDKP